MTLDLTRRSLLKFMGGAMAGAVLSPLPWKLLDDVSIWTQNNGLIAKLPRGPVTWRHGTCTLCPTGCGLRARMVGDSFVSTWPEPGHPLGGAHLCPLGLGMAQLRFHPTRIRGAARRDAQSPDAPWRLVDADAAVSEAGRKLAACRTRGGSHGVGVLDLRPDRAMSRLYAEFLDHLGGGHYLTVPDARQASAAAFAALAPAAAGRPGFDFTRARSVLSFGAPLHEDWLGAGSALGRPDEPRPFLIQVDACVTTTAGRADRWLVARPGSEAPLALTIAQVLVDETLRHEPRVAALADAPGGGAGSFRALLADFAPERTAPVTGLAADEIRQIARELAARRPAAVVGVGDPTGGPLGEEEEWAVWSLNLLLGALGPEGAVVGLPTPADLFGEPPLPGARRLADLEDGSLDVLLVDGSFPGSPVSAALLRRKLSGPDALVLALSPYVGGVAAGADVVLPTFAPGEWIDDVFTPALAARASYSWSAALSTPPDWARHPADWLARLASAAGVHGSEAAGSARHEALLAARASALQQRGRGDVFDPRDSSSAGVASLLATDSMAGILSHGGCWTAPEGDPLAAGEIRLPTPDSTIATRWLRLARGRSPDDTRTDNGLLLSAGGGAPHTAGGVAPPVLTKLYRESGLKPGARQARLNPDTARHHHLEEGATVELRAGDQALRVAVTCDASLPPGLVRVATGPTATALGDAGDAGDDQADILELCGASQRAVWRLTSVTLREVRHA